MTTLKITSAHRECVQYMFWRLQEMCVCLHMKTQLSEAEQGEETIHELALTYPKKYREILIIELTSLIAQSIAYSFKRSYFKRKLRLSCEDERLASALLTSYAVFDRQAELAYYEKLRLGEDINIDGIYHFMLSGMRENWSKACALFGRYSVKSPEFAIRVIRHICSGSSHILPYVRVERGEAQNNTLTDSDGRPIRLHGENILDLLIWLNPERVEVSPQAYAGPSLSYARQIFCAGDNLIDKTRQGAII